MHNKTQEMLLCIYKIYKKTISPFVENISPFMKFYVCLIPQVQKLYLAIDSDRLKLLVLYSGEDDERLRKAAAGTLAVLTGEMPELCARIPSTVSCFCVLAHNTVYKLGFVLKTHLFWLHRFVTTLTFSI